MLNLGLDMPLLLCLLSALLITGYLVYKNKAFYTFLLFAGLYIILTTDKIKNDFANSVSPGWHTTIYPPNYFLLQYVIFLYLLLIAGAYWYLEKYNLLNRVAFITHSIFTIPCLLYILMPVNHLFYTPGSQSIQEAIKEKDNVIFIFSVVAKCLFASGQVLFIIWFIKRVQQKHGKVQL